MGKMSRWGIGPLFAAGSFAYGAAMLLLGRWLAYDLTIRIIPRPLLAGLAWLLLGVGIPFFIAALFSLHRAYNSNQLVTTGIFSLCRNPIYAAWVVFLVPALMLFQANWLALSVPVFMYGYVRVLVRHEERYLETRFGDSYREYRRRVFCVIPLSGILPKFKSDQ